MQIIDGFKDMPHITSQQIADVNIGIFGAGDCVLNVGQKFKCELKSNNEIVIYDGAAVLQGRRVVTLKGVTDSLVIENGIAGATRNDLVVIRYSVDPATLIENASLVMVKGTNNVGDPVINDSTTIRNGDTVHDKALYRVRLNGLAIAGVDTLFSIWSAGPSLADILSLVYRVGDVKQTRDPANPATYYGFGTWELTQVGRYGVGVDKNNALYNAALKTGGSADAVVVAHGHDMTHVHENYGTFWNGNPSGTDRGRGAGEVGDDQGGMNYYTKGPTPTVTGSTGESGANKNLPPFQTWYYWLRTA